MWSNGLKSQVNVVFTEALPRLLFLYKQLGLVEKPRKGTCYFKGVAHTRTFRASKADSDDIISK